MNKALPFVLLLSFFSYNAKGQTLECREIASSEKPYQLLFENISADKSITISTAQIYRSAGGIATIFKRINETKSETVWQFGREISSIDQSSLGDKTIKKEYKWSIPTNQYPWDNNIYIDHFKTQIANSSPSKAISNTSSWYKMLNDEFVSVDPCEFRTKHYIVFRRTGGPDSKELLSSKTEVWFSQELQVALKSIMTPYDDRGKPGKAIEIKANTISLRFAPMM